MSYTIDHTDTAFRSVDDYDVCNAYCDTVADLCKSNFQDSVCAAFGWWPGMRKAS